MTMARSTFIHLLSGGLSLSLALSPLPAFAAPPAEEAAAEAPATDPVMDEARRLFDAGVARYTAADYEQAVSLWLEAYALVPPSFDNRFIKAELIYNVARAQQKWFEIDEDVTHLRQSRDTLARYLDEIDELYGEQAALEREKIEEQIAEIETSIAEWEEEQRRREAELAERMRPKFDFEADAREEKRNKSMIVAGAALTTLGVGGGAMFATGLILVGSAELQSNELPLAEDQLERERVVNRGLAGTALVVTGALSGVVFSSAGLPLLGVGGSSERKRKQRRREAGVDVDVAAIAPTWLPGGAGLSISGSF